MTATWFNELNKALADSKSGTESIWQDLKQQVDNMAYAPQPHASVTATLVKDIIADYYVLKNAESKTYMRLSMDEYPLWQSMDGKKTIQDLVVDYFVTSGVFARNLIIQLVHKLRANHMLVEAPQYVFGSTRAQIQKRSFGYKLSMPARALLTQELKIPGMDAVTTFLYRTVGWLFFTRPLQLVLLAIALVGLYFFGRILANPDYVIVNDVHASELLLFWAAALLPVLIHELGHALTVKHYKRDINAGGLLLYFGMPAAYVDTTDIWLEGRRPRLNTTWNGPYTGLIIGGLCAMAMSYYPRFEYNSFLFKMATVAYLTVFINVNPFLKYDGYYILSDWLGITFLRERSISFVQKNFFQKIIRREKFTRDEKIFTIFGILSVVWTVYALYLTAFFWNARMSSSLEVLLGSNYDLLTKVLNFLSTGAIVSFVALILLQVFRVIGVLINTYIRKGGLQRHTQMAVIAILLSSLAAFGLPLLSTNHKTWIISGLEILLPIGSAAAVFIFNGKYFRSNRWLGQLLFAVMAFALGAIPLVTRFVFADFADYLLYAVIVLSIAGGVVFILPAWRMIKPAQFLLAALAGIILAAVGNYFDYLQGALILVPLLGAVAVLNWFGLRGGARTPALGLIHVGVAVAAFDLAVNRSEENFFLLGAALVSFGLFHLVLARLPNLSKMEFPISSNKKDAIGYSVAVLVRRVLSQIFFESGWFGTQSFAKSFSGSMKALGINLSIAGNRFNDGELANRQTFDLTEAYGVAFDSIYNLLKNRFGDMYARATIGLGMDLIPWQYREIVSELVLSRRAWGEAVKEDARDQRSKRIKLLDRVSLFIGATYDDLRPIAAMLETNQYAAGETIITEGEPGDKFYIIESGKVQVWQKGERSVSERVNALGPGQFFGEVALVSDVPRNATIIAETPSVLLSLGREDFDTLVKSHLAFAKNIKANIHAKWILRNMPIFDELDAIELALLSNELQTETFKAGEMVIKQGDVGDKFYIVEEGKLRIYQEVNERTIELDQHSSGDYFGEIALIHKSPRTATVLALTDVTLFSLDSESFLRMLEDFQRMKESVEKAGSRRLETDKKAQAINTLKSQI